MHRKLYRSVIYLVLSLLSLICLHLFTAPSVQAHWADMSAAEIWVEQTAVRFNLTYPTGLTPFADDDQNGQLSAQEINAHRDELQAFLGKAIQLHNSDNQAAQLSLSTAPAQLTGQAAPSSHSTLQLLYTWPQPVRGLKIHYNLFLPGVSTASCLATIMQNQQLQTFVFTPSRQILALTPSSRAGLLLALGGALVWGAMHSLSPGHGKTLVSAYLVGSRATARHALVLALTTTVTHTVGIFALGLVALFASRYILPEQLYPWMNLVSGLMVAAIGFNLLRARLDRHRHGNHSHGHHGHHGHEHSHGHEAGSGYRQTSGSLVLAPVPIHASDNHLPDRTLFDSHVHGYGRHLEHHHSDSHHSHHHSHRHSHHHDHHSGHNHVHLTPDTPITWRNLLLIGISGGLIPCPAALVLLLSCVALGQVGLGLLLVGAFSLGLAGVLTGLGLLLVYAKQRFDAPGSQRTGSFSPHAVSQTVFQTIYQSVSRILPVLSATVITTIGAGLVSQAVLQIVKPL